MAAFNYNDTPTAPADPLIGWYDYGSDLQATALQAARTIVGATGVRALAGNGASLIRTRHLAASLAALELAGSAAALAYDGGSPVEPPNSAPVRLCGQW